MIIDHVSQRKGESTFTIDIANYSNGLSISTLELATMVQRTEAYSNFSLKNKIKIYPHPSRLFSLFHPMMYFYYEKWYYYSLEGGVEFIFADVSGLGDYELIHSTHRNEIHDTNWRKKLGQSTDLFKY